MKKKHFRLRDYVAISSGTSILDREVPTKLCTKSDILFSLICLKHKNFAHYHSLVCVTSMRLIFMVSDNPTIVGYANRLYNWVRFLLHVPGVPTIILALRCADESIPLDQINQEMKSLITKIKFQFGRKARIFHKPIYFFGGSLKKKYSHWVSYETLIDQCGQEVIREFPSFLPQEIVNLMTAQSSKLKKMMLKSKILSMIQQSLKIQKYDAMEVFSKVLSSCLVIAITTDRICTDLSWFYQAIINSLLNPDSIRSGAETMSILEPWFVSENMLSDCKELRDSGADFPGMIGFVCNYLAENHVWHRVQTNFDTPTYFHPVMLPNSEDELKLNLSKQIFDVQGFILARRLIPENDELIPSFVLPSLQSKLYEKLHNKKLEENIWTYQFTQTTLCFSHPTGAGFRILSPSLQKYHSKTIHQDSDPKSDSIGFDAYSFLEIHVISDNVTITCCIYFSILSLIGQLMGDFISWGEYSIPPSSITDSCNFTTEPLKEITEILKEASSRLSSKSSQASEQTSSSLQTSSYHPHFLIPDILVIDPFHSKVSYLMDKKKKILTVRISLFDIWGFVRKIPFYDKIFVGIFQKNENKKPTLAEFSSYDDVTGYYEYNVFLRNLSNSILFCCLLNQKIPFGGSPILLSNDSSSSSSSKSFIDAHQTDSLPHFHDFKENYQNHETFQYLPDNWQLLLLADEFNHIFQFHANETSKYRNPLLANYIQLKEEHKSQSLSKLIEIPPGYLEKIPITFSIDALEICRLLLKFKYFPVQNLHSKLAKNHQRKNQKKIKKNPNAGISLDENLFRLERAINRLPFLYLDLKKDQITNFKVFSNLNFLFPFFKSTLQSVCFFERNHNIYISIRAMKSEKKFKNEFYEIIFSSLFSSSAHAEKVCFFDQIEKFSNQIFDDFVAVYGKFLKNRKESRKTSIFIMGHSFGACVALVLSRIMIEKGKWKHSIITSTFGCPLFASKEYCNWEGWHSSNLVLLNFISQKDPVPNFFLRDLNWSHLGFIPPEQYGFIGQYLFVFKFASKNLLVLSGCDSIKNYLTKQICEPENILSRFILHSFSYYQEVLYRLLDTTIKDPMNLPPEFVKFSKQLG